MENNGNVFDSTTPAQPTEASPGEQPVTQGVDHPLIGTGRKYATQEEALAALMPAQDHITKLEQENARYRDDAAKAQNIEQTIQRAIDQNLSARQPTNEYVAPLPTQADDTEDGQIDARQLVRSELEYARQEDTLNANRQYASDALISALGTQAKADEALNAKAQELGVTREYYNQMASEAPQQLLSIMGVTATNTQTNALKPNTNLQGQNTEALANQVVSNDPKTYAYWQGLRRSDPKQYQQRTMERDKIAREVGAQQFFGRA